jgi:hypothetical protein
VPKFDMLPRPVANAGHVGRNNIADGISEVIDIATVQPDGTVSLRPSTATGDNRRHAIVQRARFLPAWPGRVRETSSCDLRLPLAKVPEQRIARIVVLLEQAVEQGFFRRASVLTHFQCPQFGKAHLHRGFVYPDQRRRPASGWWVT